VVTLLEAKLAHLILEQQKGTKTTSIRAKRMLSHDITELHEVLDVYSTLISITHCEGHISSATIEHQRS
jgi:hypothetical protein